MITVQLFNNHKKLWPITVVLSILLFSCGKAPQAEQTVAAESMVQDETIPPGLVEIKAVGLTLEADDEIQSGWTTIRFINESDMVHLLYLYRVPEGKGIADHKEIAAIFQNLMDGINGKPPSEPEASEELPEWFGQVVPYGGNGLTSPRKISEAMVYLDPGTYLIECYVKTDGIFHSYMPSPTQYGMVHEFTVVAENTQMQQPVPTINIDISAESGYSISGDHTPGSHVVGVTFVDQQPHENFLGHDVHLIKIAEDTNLEEVISWVDWREPTGLQTPAPAEFLGGTNEFPAGEQAYFTVELEPGRYAWIAEVPNADEKGMLVEFEVGGAQ